MSGVLHPVGPEPASTYWLRRALVVGVLVVVLVTLIALATRGGDRRQAVPVAPSSVLSSAPASTVAPSSPAAGSGPASGPATPGSTGPGPSRSVTSRSPRPEPATPAACAPAALRATLTGQRRLRPEERTTFALSVINGSEGTCHVSVTAKNFRLEIYSGQDRIWSSRDCSTAVEPVTATLGRERAVEWRMSWNGRRSAPDCKNRPEIPESGTYVATARLTGAEPVRMRMTLSG